MAAAAAKDYSALVLGRDGGLHSVRDIGDNRAAATALLRQARREVRIVSCRLAPPVFDSEEIAAAVRTAIAGNRRYSLQVLIFDPRGLSGSGHRLLGLSARLASFVQFRSPSPDREIAVREFLVADGAGFLNRPVPDRWEGAADFNDALRCRELLAEFEEIWATADQDTELRRLSL